MLSDEDRARETAFRRHDELIGADAAARYGIPLESGSRLRPAWLARAVLHKAAASPPGVFLRKALRRVRRELIRRAHPFERRLRSRVGARSSSFEVAPEPVSAEEGNALLARTTARFLVLLRRGGELTRRGADDLDEAIARLGTAELIYGDSRGPTGVRFAAPDHSPFRLRSEDYLGPVVAVSVEALRRQGGFDPRADGAHVLDLALRAEPERVVRLRHVLGWGSAFDERPGEPAERAAAVVRRYLDDVGVEAHVRQSRLGRRHVVYPAGPGSVSVVIPTRGGSGTIAGAERVFVVEAVRGLVERSTFDVAEFVVVADDATPQHVVDELEALAGERLVLVRWSEPFDFSAKMNRGAAVARGDHLLLLNDDVDLIAADSVERMLAIVQQPGVGMAGALLYFEDGSIQHMGHLYQGGGAGHVGFGITPGALVPLETLTPTREVSGVTAACSLISADLFAEVGGFSLRFPGNYNDVDLSLKVRISGATVLCTGDASLYHFESKTRDARIQRSELLALRERWGTMVQRDEYSREQESAV